MFGIGPNMNPQKCCYFTSVYNLHLFARDSTYKVSVMLVLCCNIIKHVNIWWLNLTLLVYDDECCICLQHLQRLSPQEWLLPIVVLGLEIYARTNRFLRLFGCLKATMERLLTKLITYPGAVYFSTKKNINVKKTLCPHIPSLSEKQLQHHSWTLDIRRKKFKTVQSLSWASHGCLQTTKQSINSANYFVLFSGDLTGIRWRVLHMFTALAAFVSTRVTLAYSCVTSAVNICNTRHRIPVRSPENSTK
jgi:hypothetical protein